MKPIKELNLGFSDAENYKRRENKDIFNQIFIRNNYLEKLCEPSISFLIGEKGTGKTAYAVYLSNNEYKNTLSSIKYTRETDYQKFYTLKKTNRLEFSNYENIWKVIVYVLITIQIIEREDRKYKILSRFSKMNELKSALDEYYENGLSPEITQAFQLVQDSEAAADVIAKYANASISKRTSRTSSESKFQMNLLYIERKLEDALKQVRCSRNHILFIDGIDIRPSSIPYSEYLECIKGLANAIWAINNDIFPSIKGGEGRLRCVLLIRPDIFDSLGLQNQNTKLRNNSVFLDWQTEYINYRESGLFKVVDNLLSFSQTEKLPTGETWNSYFPWNTPNVLSEIPSPSSFVSFLRWSYYRPRDIITMLTSLQEFARQNESKCNKTSFDYELFDSPSFKRDYSQYLLGEIKDQLTFYYTPEEYEVFLSFFPHLNGMAEFDYKKYKSVFSRFRSSIESKRKELPSFMSDQTTFLQFLYDLNVICYIEEPKDDKRYFRWCFRERNNAIISPKVKENVKYQVFYGLRKALNVGSEFSS